MRRVCQALTAVMGGCFICFDVWLWGVWLRRYHHSLLELKALPDNVEHVILIVFVVFLSGSIIRALRCHYSNQPHGTRMLAATLSVFLFGVFGFLFVSGTFLKAIKSDGMLAEFFGIPTNFFRLITYLLGFALSLYISIRVIQRNDGRPARLRSIFPPWLIATLLFLPVVQTVFDGDSTWLAFGMKRISWGIILSLLAFRTFRILRGSPDENLRMNSDGSETDQRNGTGTIQPSS